MKMRTLCRDYISLCACYDGYGQQVAVRAERYGSGDETALGAVCMHSVEQVVLEYAVVGRRSKKMPYNLSVKSAPKR